MGWINTMFQNVKRVLHQNKAHTKISSGLQFCRSISYTFIFPAYIFATIFGKPNDQALHQKGLRLIHISYNRIDRIIMAKMDYMEN